MVELVLSVHQLVDFLLRTGSIDNRVYNRNTMLMGSKIHAYYQKKQNNEYISEYPLKEDFIVNDFKVTLQGRADGIIVTNNGKVTIDEIKSTVEDLNKFYEEQSEWHLGQAKCYALMYAHEKHLEKISITLTYISQVDDTQIQKNFSYKVNDIERYVNNLLKRYLDFYTIIYQKKIRRNNSSESLRFPFKDFREGQKKLAQVCYNVANNGGVLYVEAPTGTGKTMSTLYPFVKSFAKGFNEKIFYLTAKTSGRESAYKATEILKENGLLASEIIITAKDKICLNPGKACNPKECPYALNYYNKIKELLVEMIVKENSFDFNTIVKYAIDNDVCPFELQLDLSLYNDIIICDYNYLFDPVVYMKRYFDEDSSHFISLIDEAHNLVTRSRDMYSCSLSYENFKKAKEATKEIDNKNFLKSVRKLNKEFKKYLELYDENIESTIISYLSDEFYIALDTFYRNSQQIMKDYEDQINEDFTTFFFEVNKFLKLYEFYNSSFRLFIEFKNSKFFDLNLYCVDASSFVKSCLNKLKASIIFSATLSPIEYYVQELGGNDESLKLLLDSPFPIDNQLIMVQNNVSTKYKDRNASINEVVISIITFINQKVGNYFVFFPSYQYMQDVLNKIPSNDDMVIYEQSVDMNEKDKISFLNKFQENPSKTTVGFVVLGGVFSEGIDLLDDRLIGAVIVGVGVPRINFKQDLIKEYHDLKGCNGFNYAYVNVGINHVMQALGRVIRSETDKGSILLIDERYNYSQYRKIFRGHLRYYEIVKGPNDIKRLTDEFWNKK